MQIFGLIGQNGGGLMFKRFQNSSSSLYISTQNIQSYIHTSSEFGRNMFSGLDARGGYEH